MIKIFVKLTKEIDRDDFDIIDENGLAARMFRNRVLVSSQYYLDPIEQGKIKRILSEWINHNINGLYNMDRKSNDIKIMFENHEDMIAFKLYFDGADLDI